MEGAGIPGIMAAGALGQVGVKGIRGTAHIIKHRKALKNIIMKMSTNGNVASKAKIQQLKRVVTKLGGTVRTEIGGGRSGKYKDILHSHIDGLGRHIKNRHIVHE